MLRLLTLLHATAAAFPMLGAEIPLGERTKMSWDAPPNGDDGVDPFLEGMRANGFARTSYPAAMPVEVFRFRRGA